MNYILKYGIFIKSFACLTCVNLQTYKLYILLTFRKLFGLVSACLRMTITDRLEIDLIRVKPRDAMWQHCLRLAYLKLSMQNSCILIIIFYLNKPSVIFCFRRKGRKHCLSITRAVLIQAFTFLKSLD